MMDKCILKLTKLNLWRNKLSKSKIKNRSFKDDKNNLNSTMAKINNKDLLDSLKDWEAEIKELSYEESLEALNVLLNDLQSDNTSLNDIQKLYLQGNIYLSHCQKLIEGVEQEIVELNIESLELE